MFQYRGTGSSFAFAGRSRRGRSSGSDGAAEAVLVLVDGSDPQSFVQ